MSFTLQQIYDRCEEVGDCRLWKQSCTPSGFPRIKGGYAHIKAWECVHGPVPEGKFLRRTCDETRCCEVKHMELMTRRRQNAIAAKRGSWNGPARIAKITLKARERAKLDLAKVELIRSSDRAGADLARELGVSKSLVSRVRKRKAWVTRPGASIFSGALA